MRAAGSGSGPSWLLARHPRFCFVLERTSGGGEGVAIGGFIMARTGPEVVSAGPWVVAPGAERAEALLLAVIAAAGPQSVRLGVLETNAEAVALIRRLGFEELRPSLRMAFGPPHNLALSGQLHAMGSPGRG